MPQLIAIAAPPGPRFLAALTRAWDEGNAVLPVDPRLPVPAASALLRAMRPSALVDETGQHQQLEGGEPVDVGDALVVATSGTTGEPKGVVLTHDAVAASATATSARLAVDPTTDRWLAVLPVAHIGGLSVLTRAIVTGTPVTFDPDDPDATLVSLVPTQLGRMNAARFRVVLLGGSADWRDDRPANVVRTYGMTETGSGIAYDGVPLDGVDVRIDDASGEIAVRGPMLLRCYRDGVDPKGADGWLNTGDAGEWAPGGSRLVVHGRIGDVIVTGGEKVWPVAVEAVLAAAFADSVAELAVAGLPDQEWGERVVAWLVPAPGATAPTIDDVRGAVKAVLPAFAAPTEIFIVRGLSRTESGKVRRRDLS